MGIDLTSLNAILMSQKYVSNKENMLTLGRQHIHVDAHNYNILLKNYNVTIENCYSLNCEKMFVDMGYQSVDSMDCSSYENATIIHDLNTKIVIDKKYDYIYDGGTIEHVFNIPQVFENVINLLNIDGIFCSVTVNNNLSGHGFYQFSPEIFLSCFLPKYGMELQELYIAKVNTLSTEWIDVKSYGDNTNGRNISRFFSNDMVYIVSISKKISNTRLSLIEYPPQQYSYEQIDWKK
jgi:hypothetical protein